MEFIHPIQFSDLGGERRLAGATSQLVKLNFGKQTQKCNSLGSRPSPFSQNIKYVENKYINIDETFALINGTLRDPELVVYSSPHVSSSTNGVKVVNHVAPHHHSVCRSLISNGHNRRKSSSCVDLTSPKRCNANLCGEKVSTKVERRKKKNFSFSSSLSDSRSTKILPIYITAIEKLGRNGGRSPSRDISSERKDGASGEGDLEDASFGAIRDVEDSFFDKSSNSTDDSFAAQECGNLRLSEMAVKQSLLRSKEKEFSSGSTGKSKVSSSDANFNISDEPLPSGNKVPVGTSIAPTRGVVRASNNRRPSTVMLSDLPISPRETRGKGDEILRIWFFEDVETKCTVNIQGETIQRGALADQLDAEEGKRVNAYNCFKKHVRTRHGSSKKKNRVPINLTPSDEKLLSSSSIDESSSNSSIPLCEDESITNPASAVSLDENTASIDCCLQTGLGHLALTRSITNSIDSGEVSNFSVTCNERHEDTTEEKCMSILMDDVDGGKKEGRNEEEGCLKRKDVTHSNSGGEVEANDDIGDIKQLMELTPVEGAGDHQHDLIYLSFNTHHNRHDSACLSTSTSSDCSTVSEILISRGQYSAENHSNEARLSRIPSDLSVDVLAENSKPMKEREPASDANQSVTDEKNRAGLTVSVVEGGESNGERNKIYDVVDVLSWRLDKNQESNWPSQDVGAAGVGQCNLDSSPLSDISILECRPTSQNPSPQRSAQTPTNSAKRSFQEISSRSKQVFISSLPLLSSTLSTTVQETGGHRITECGSCKISSEIEMWQADNDWSVGMANTAPAAIPSSISNFDLQHHAEKNYCCLSKKLRLSS